MTSTTEPVTTAALSPIRPRKATAAEAGTIAGTLAAAFFDDPVIGWAWHDPRRRRQILPAFFELMAAGSLEHDQAYTTDDLAGAALWLPPAALEASDDQADAFAAMVEQVTHEFASTVLRLFAILDDDHHPHEPLLPAHRRHQTRAAGARYRIRAAGRRAGRMRPAAAALGAAARTTAGPTIAERNASRYYLGR